MRLTGYVAHMQEATDTFWSSNCKGRDLGGDLGAGETRALKGTIEKRGLKMLT
jgi:hypothetical protein